MPKKKIKLFSGWIFAMSSGLFSTFAFLKTYRFLLVDLKESFTLGEAGLISQGLTLFFYCAGVNMFTYGSSNVAKSNMQISSIIIQV